MQKVSNHPAWWDEAAGLRENGWSLRDIGQQYNVSYEAVRLAMRALDIKPLPEAKEKRARLKRPIRYRYFCAKCKKVLKKPRRLCGNCNKEKIDQERDLFYSRIKDLWEDGYSTQEIADKLGTTSGYIGSALNRARKRGYNIPYRKYPNGDYINFPDNNLA